MRATGVISVSDYPLIGPDRQCYGEKPHMVFTKLPFQTQIGDLISYPSSEISTFSNNPEADIRNYVRVAERGLGGKGAPGFGPESKRKEWP